MVSIRKNKIIPVFLLICFVIFIFNDTCFAKEKYPQLVRIDIKMDIGVKVKRIKKQIVPVEIQLNHRRYHVVKKDGRYGINIKARDLTNISPDFKDKLATSVSALGLYRVQQLVKNDKKKAQEVIQQHRQLQKAAINQQTSTLMACVLTKMSGFFTTFFVNDAHAASGAAKVDQQYLANMNKSYNQVLNSQAFAYPIVQPGIGGWDLLNEAERQNIDSSESQNANPDNENEEDTEEKSWYDKFLDVFFGIVLVIAPIAAIVFLCTNPFTLASVLMSLAIANGAVTGAGIISSVLGSVGDLLSGKPLLEITDVVRWGSGSDQIYDNSSHWP